MGYMKTYPLKMTIDGKEMDAVLTLVNVQRGYTWYIKGQIVQSMEELSTVFGLDEETITMLILKYGKPHFTSRAPATAVVLKNIRKIADEQEKRILRAWGRNPGRDPYHA